MAPSGATLLLFRLIRDWLEAMGVDRSLVVPGNNLDATRPVGNSLTPFYQITMPSRGERIPATDEKRVAMDGTLTLIGGRRTTIQVMGIGVGADQIIDHLESSIDWPDVETIIDAAGVAIEEMGPSLDVSANREDRIEPRFVREIRILYLEEWTSDPGAVATALTVEYGIELSNDDDGFDPLEADVVVQTEGSFSSAFSSAFAKPVVEV